MTGIFGAISLVLSGDQYSRTPKNNVGDDIAAGIIVQGKPSEVDANLRIIFGTLV